MKTPGRVLLVDDDPKVLRLLEATLRLKDYDVVKMESGAEALRWLKQDVPDLIISDIMMPDLDGYDFFRRVRASTEASGVPFIFLSARSEPEDVVRGLRLGADEFLRKPFSIDELLVRVERVLTRGSAVKAVAEEAGGGGRGVFEGDLQHMALSDVLRMMCVQRKTGLLQVQPARTRGAGAIQLDEGQAVHAELGLLRGEIALLQILMCERGRFSFRPEEELPDRSIESQTLPLLMEAFRLMDVGVLRRIDANDKLAVAAFSRIVDDRRADVAPLPRLADLEEPSIPLGMPGMAIRLTRGRPAVATNSGDWHMPEPGEVPEEEENDFSETVQLDSSEIFDSSDDLPSLGDLIDEAERHVTDLRSAEPGGPDRWDRADLLGGSISVVDAFERSGLLSTVPDPGLGPDEATESEDVEDDIEETSDQEPIELEKVARAVGKSISLGKVSRGEMPKIGPVTPRDNVQELRPAGDLIALNTEPPPMMHTPLEGVPTLSEEPPADPDGPSGRIYLTEPTAVALVEDGSYEAPAVEMEKSAGPGGLMDLYEELKVVSSKQLKSRQVQLGTRSGRVIASAIRDEARRGTVAAFSAQAIAFASEDPSGLQFAVLDARDLHVVVVEVDHLRVFTVLFDRKPEPQATLGALSPIVTAWRQARS